MTLLLDTHTWIWSVTGDTRRIGPRSRRRLEQAAARDAIRVSPASAFEVTALHLCGRLTLTLPADGWIREALAIPGVRVAELTVAVATDAGQIARTALPDPMDRLLVATAQRLDATLLTADTAMLEYATRSGLRVANASL